MNARKSAVKWAGASALSVLLASTSVFAAPRHDRNQNGNDDQNAQGTQVQTQAQVENQRGNFRRNGQQQAAPVVSQPVVDARANTYGAQHQQSDSRTNNQTWGNASQSRGRIDQSNAYQSNANRSNNYRENQRVNVTGRIQSFNRERNGYRIHLDNGSYWIPEARFGNRARDLRVGLAISFGGIFRGGAFGIDAVTWPASGYGYDQAYVRGVVQHIDYRSGTMTLRDAATGRLFEVDMRDAGFGSRLGRGDFVTLSGQWTRGGVFAAYRVDSVG